jgi:hypothetical protein
MSYAASQNISAQEIEDQLFGDIYATEYDPSVYVNYAFPWRERGTLLQDEPGPDKWQIKVMDIINRGIAEEWDNIRIAVSSGNGIGKGALIAWLILWFISTHEHPQIVVTAGTEKQLQTKTWRELAKWWKMAINRHWFSWSATMFKCIDDPETWFAAAIPWSENNSEAFAGTHEKNVLFIFDEASSIARSIWQASEGAMTTKGAIWLAFGNPTQSTGEFHSCFHRMKHRWNTITVDSRTARMTNKSLLQQWIDDYGIDSDFVKVHILGQFPSASTVQFIPTGLVNTSCNRVLTEDMYSFAPVILGGDVARFGDDQSALLVRQGLKILKLKRYRGLDTMTYAGFVIEFINEFNPAVVFIDEIGIGAGVIDRLRQLGYKNIIGVQAGAASTDKKYFNKRSEMWGKTKDWLENGGQLPRDQELKDDLIAPEYMYAPRGEIKLEPKDNMKSRGLSSPDTADALVHTFYQDVAIAIKPKPRTAPAIGGSSSWMGR